jgi:dipeptidyl aminopeptidase/acylaminoacyl peptidase
VDPGRIGLAGDSEGAMISLFIASMRADIDCVVAVSAPVELGRMFKGYPSWMRRVASVPGLYDAIGGTPEEVPHEYRERSALYVAHRISSPVLIIHGGRDPIVPVEQAYLLDKALRRAGILHETLILPQATHGIFTGREKDEIAELVWNRADGFLDRHLLK